MRANSDDGSRPAREGVVALVDVGNDDLVPGLDAVRVGGEGYCAGVIGNGEEGDVAIGGCLERGGIDLNTGDGGDFDVGIGRKEVERGHDEIAIR